MTGIWLWLIWWAMFLLWLKQYWVFKQFLRFAGITFFFSNRLFNGHLAQPIQIYFFRPNMYDKPNNKSNCMTDNQWSVVFCNFNASNDNLQLKENVTSKQLAVQHAYFLVVVQETYLYQDLINKNVLKIPPVPKILDLSFYIDHLPSFWHFLLLAWRLMRDAEGVFKMNYLNTAVLIL